tara:strand:+ start:71 stop:274 length:204 start_codon:yes stop_codon:yes gene_type:complete
LANFKKRPEGRFFVYQKQGLPIYDIIFRFCSRLQAYAKDSHQKSDNWEIRVYRFAYTALLIVALGGK